ncbi:MAG: hypothetical protein GY788_28605 [bacterium]|nr:hypothetical protein [bacterium]
MAATDSCIENAHDTLNAYVHQALNWMTYGRVTKPQAQGEAREPAELVEELPTAGAVEP